MKVEVNGIQLFYETKGQGPPLILLHGNGEDHHIFDESADRLAKKMDCVPSGFPGTWKQQPDKGIPLPGYGRGYHRDDRRTPN